MKVEKSGVLGSITSTSDKGSSVRLLLILGSSLIYARDLKITAPCLDGNAVVLK